MINISQLLPTLEADEMSFVQNVTGDMLDSEIQHFSFVYKKRRRDPQTIFQCTLLGFIFIAGIQRFILKQFGMGIIYFVTGGFFLIGTLIDLLRYKKLALEYNKKIALQAAAEVKIL